MSGQVNRGQANLSAGYPAPRGSILYIPDPEPAFPRGKFAQALIDIIALALFALFICATAISLPVAIFILLFVEVH